MKLLFGVIVSLLLAVMPISVNNASAQSLNNFSISSFDIDYTLSRDENNRSVLKTVETITAEFPSYDQNHGLERAIPTSYDGHSLNLSITSVTNQDDAKLQYSTYAEGDMMIMRIGDADSYVHGSQVYKITYEQHDVTKFFADNNRDEWYWDTNGTQWQVPIDSLRVTYTIDEALLAAAEGEPACYKGAAGSTIQCSIDATGRGEYAAMANSLSAGDNVTIAVGFEQGTFVAYEPTFGERLAAAWFGVFIVTTLLGAVALVGLSIAYARKLNRLKELAIVVTEYIPPKGTSVMVSAQVITPTGGVFSAQLIDFAVRHFIEIIETKEKSFWKQAEYDIKIITDPTRLLEEEQEILSDMFGTLPKLGDRLALSTLRSNTSYYSRTTDNDKKLKALIEGKYAIREKLANVSKYFYRWSIAMLVVGILTLSPILLLFAGIVALLGYFIRPLTDKGLELRRYLLGLQRYIKAAEAERLKFLQGPDTAQKIGESIDTNDPGQLVKLYERVLPYAILFGLEKEWSKRLSEFYATTNTQPDWYSGNAVFNAALFSTALSSFSAAASYSGGSSSSSSSGSSGGGSSGGGGGGGGGGGW
ncbi:MAG: DUF2207 domain-containing protein [Patescibacteria group bacterium]